MSFEGFMVTFVLAIIVPIWFFVLEVQAYFKQKKILRDLYPLMEQWNTCNLTESEKQYLRRAVRKMNSPFSVLLLMVKVPFLPWLDIQRSPVGLQLETKNPDLFFQTFQYLNRCLICTSPTLTMILLLELAVCVSIYTLVSFMIKLSIRLPKEFYSRLPIVVYQ